MASHTFTFHESARDDTETIETTTIYTFYSVILFISIIALLICLDFGLSSPVGNNHLFNLVWPAENDAPTIF